MQLAKLWRLESLYGCLCFTFIFTLLLNPFFMQEVILTPHQTELVNQERKMMKENPDYMLDWEETGKLFVDLQVMNI
jgi:hypothetical protein